MLTYDELQRAVADRRQACERDARDARLATKRRRRTRARRHTPACAFLGHLLAARRQALS